jgi:tRNA A-37 threonylcarbamoyl transferase component Bud32
MPTQQIRDAYEIIGEIGAGGMATVYKAIQKSLDRPVAIKELKRIYHTDGQIVRRFERESRIAASLQHENIVHIYDYWKKPHHAIVMEYVDGTNLAEIIEKTGPLPVDVGVMIAIQVCDALEYAHMRGLVHRDIKPSNIMIKRNGEVKLMDFGIAHTRNLESLTLPGTLIGTPSYMSPEQILGQELDVRSDIFSFGIVLYEMFTGIKPFADDDSRPVTTRIVQDAFRSPRRVNSAIPRRLQCLIKKCLRKKPHRRYGSMLDVGRRLGNQLAGRTTKAASLLRISAYLVSKNVLAPAPAEETMVITSRPRGKGRFAAAAVVVTITLTAAAAGTIFYLRPSILRSPVTAPAFAPAPEAVRSPDAITRTAETSSVSTSAQAPEVLSSQIASTTTTSGMQRVSSGPSPTEQLKKQAPAQGGKRPSSSTGKRKKKPVSAPR